MGLGQAVAFVLVAAAAVAGYVVLYRRATPRPVRLEVEYLIHPPADLPPALVGMLFEPNVTPEEIAATLLDLARRNVITLDRAGMPGAGGGPDDDRVLFLHRDRAAGLEQFEQELVYEVFDHIGGGEDRVRTRDLREWWRRHPATAGAIQAIWTVRLRQAMVLRGLIDAKAQKTRQILTLYGAAVTFAMMSAIVLGVWGALFFSIGVVMVFWAQRVTGVTQQGAKMRAKYAAFRHYLADYGRFRDKPADAVVLWEEYLALAVVLGLGDKAEVELRIGPGLFRPASPGDPFPDETQGLAYMGFRRAYDPGLPTMRVGRGDNPTLSFSGGYQGALTVSGPGGTRTLLAQRHPARALLAISPFVLFPVAFVALALLFGH